MDANSPLINLERLSHLLTVPDWKLNEHPTNVVGRVSQLTAAFSELNLAADLVRHSLHEHNRVGYTVTDHAFRSARSTSEAKVGDTTDMPDQGGWVKDDLPAHGGWVEDK